MTTVPSVEPDLMDPALIADPYRGYGRLREQGPVLRGRTMDGGQAWYVTRQDDVRTGADHVQDGSDHRLGDVLGADRREP